MSSDTIYTFRITSLILTLMLSIALPVKSQSRLEEFTKHFTRKERVARDCHDIEVTNDGLVMVATGYGINVFNGYAWDMKLMDKPKHPRFNKLKRDEKNAHRYYVGGLSKIGFFVLKNDRFRFKEIISFKENKEKLGGRLLNIYQKDERIFFLGASSGCIVYNQQTGQKSYVPPINNTVSFSSLKINQDILITSAKGDLFKLSGNHWLKLVAPPSLIQQYQPIFLKEFENSLLVLISSEKKFYLKTGTSDIREIPRISALIKGGAKFQVKQQKKYLVILTNELLLKLNLANNEIGFQYTFKQLAANDFAFDLQGNIWVTTNNGVLYIELNEKFTFQPNNKGIRKSKRLGNYEVYLLKSEHKIEINNSKRSQTIIFDGFVSDVTLDNNRFLVSTSKGLYKIDTVGSFRKKILNGKFRRVVNYLPKQVFLLAGTQTLQVLNKEYKVINTIRLTDGGIYNTFISTDGVIYYSTVNEVYQIRLSSDFKSVLSRRKLAFPAKTRYSFSFFEKGNRVYIVNALGLFKVDNHEKITCLTANLQNLPLNEQGIYHQKFSFAKPLANNRFFLTPVYSGGDKSRSFPGVLSKNQAGRYTFETRDFKRIGSTVTTDVKKLDSNHIQIITQKKIITCNLNKGNIPAHKFNSYIREVSLKQNISDTIQGDLVENNYKDSIIYQGITQQHKVEKIPYGTNSITLKFASNYYVATEANRYSYKLEGLEKSWSNWSKEQKKEYTNLREGTYTFQVRCKNVYGTISSVDTYTFTILPPWYRTWWAYTLYLLIGVSLTVGASMSYNQYRSRQLRKRNRELEQTVALRTEEISGQKAEITQQATQLKVTNESLNAANAQLQVTAKELKTTNQALHKTNLELQTTNEALEDANAQIKKEQEDKLKYYVQRVSDSNERFVEVIDIFKSRGLEVGLHFLENELNTAGKMASIQAEVREAYPEFIAKLDKVLLDEDITYTQWKVGQCLKLGKSANEISALLDVKPSTIYSYGSRLRKAGLL
ncbi:triple tyrosine motif-containing protein [Microscilla marina]|nr:triple tyrosine motif-containing protein [Microscilla marina]